jgi:hypothetical protein
MTIDLSSLPPLYSQDGVKNPTVHALLLGANGWLWAITEFSPVAPDKTPNLAFGIVFGDEDEFGYISLDEIAETNAPYLTGNEPVWQDPSFTPCPLSELKEKVPDIKKGLRRALERGMRPLIKV